MLSRLKILVCLILLLGSGVLGCGASSTDVLLPKPDGVDSISESESHSTIGNLQSLEGTSIPLADIYVDDELVSFTDEIGNYEIDLAPGEHSISFGFDDVIFQETTIDMNSRNVMRFPDPPAVGMVGGIVLGKPLDQPDGEFAPVEGAIVIVADIDSRWIGADVTGPEGKYLIRKAPAGVSRLMVFAKGYSPWVEKIFVNPDSLLVRDIFLRDAPRLGHLLGLVRDAEFSPLADVNIQLEDPNDPEFERTAITRKCGAFMINKLEPGRYILHANKEGYVKVDRKVCIGRGRNFIKFRMFPVDDSGGGG